MQSDINDQRQTEKEYEYNNLGQLIKIINKDREYSYIDTTEGGKELGAPGPVNNYETTIEYNMFNEIERITQPFDSENTRSVLFQYDAQGRVCRITDEDYAFITENRGGVNYISMDYNYFENKLKTTDQLGNENFKYFDMKDRLLKTTYRCIISENGSISSESIDTYAFYDGVGNCIVTVDGRGNAVINQYDSLNRLTRTILPEVDAGHGFIEKQGDTYGEVIGWIPAIEYEYTFGGFKKTEKTGYIGIDEDSKLVTEFILDELGRVCSTINEYTQVSQVNEFSGTDVSSFDWSTYNWPATAWNETGNKISLKRVVYYDENNNQIRTIDPANTALRESGTDYYCTEYEYSARNKVKRESAFVKRSSTDTLLDAGEQTVFAYNLSDNATLMTDPFGFSIQYYYDDTNRLILAVKPKNERETINPYVWFEYGENNKVRLKEEGPDGEITHYTYNSRGLVTFKGLRDNLTSLTNTYETEYRYDAAGNCAQIIDNEDNITEKYYDLLKRENFTEYADGRQVWTGYDRSGNKTVIREGSNNELEERGWTYYDKYNQPIKTVDPYFNENKLWYDIFGNVRKNEDEKGRRSYYESGRVIREVNKRNMVYYHGYDIQGNTHLNIDPNGTKTVYFYDYKNQCIGEAAENSGKIQWKAYEYDEQGNVKTVSTSENMQTSYNIIQGAYIPDPYGRIFSTDNNVNDERDFRIEYEFDSAGRITSFMYPDGNTLDCTYNRFGQLLSMPDYINNSPLYNANGIMSRMTNFNGVTITYGYDLNNRIDKIEYQSTPEGNNPFKAYNLHYDKFGNIDTLNGGEYFYDQLNRLERANITGKFEVDAEHKESTPKAGSASRDILGEKAISFSGENTDILILDAGAISIGIGFGDINREVSRIRLYPDTPIDETGNLGKANFAVFVADINNDLNYTLVPDSDWVVKYLDNGTLEIKFRKPIDCRYIKVHCFCDERDGDNNPVLTDSFFKNIRSSLIRMYYVVNLRQEAYTYDETGNRTTSMYKLDGEDHVNTQYIYYNNSDHLKWDGTYAYNWDNNGNHIAKGTHPQQDFEIYNNPAVFSASEGEYTEYTYDLFNRLINVRKSESGTGNCTVIAEYQYDAYDMRIKKVKYDNDTTTTTHFYCFTETGELIFDETVSEYSKYIYVMGNLFCKETGTRSESNGAAIYTKGTTYYYHTDHLGNTTAITDSTGRLLWQDDLTPFGESSGHLGIIEENAFYTGKELDIDTGLYYFNARWYDPGIGRFTSEDPARDGVNWFVYAGNNPLLYIDPNGLEKIIISGGIAGYEKSRYNFIETAIRQINVSQNQNPDEKITWAISTHGYTEKEIESFKETADKSGVNIVLFDDKDTLITYMNEGEEGNRKDDKITLVADFSHGGTGEKGGLWLAYGQDEAIRDKTDITIEDIEKFNKEAFDNPISLFYSCNTGTGGEESFAQEWVDQVGGVTQAAVGKTSYYDINEDRDFWDKVGKQFGGSYYETGSLYAPVPDYENNAYWDYFTPSYEEEQFDYDYYMYDEYYY